MTLFVDEVITFPFQNTNLVNFEVAAQCVFDGRRRTNRGYRKDMNKLIYTQWKLVKTKKEKGVVCNNFLNKLQETFHSFLLSVVSQEPPSFLY